MALGGSDSELPRTLEDLIARQTRIDKRVERLESLEFHNARNGLGCITFVDYDIARDAVKRVDTTPAVVPYPYTTMTIFWCLFAYTSPPVPLYMQIDGLVAANYNYALSYTQAGATNDIAADGQTAWLVGYLGQYNFAIGRIDLPMWPLSCYPRAFGEWTMYDSTEEAGATVQRGNWGGFNVAGARRPFRFDFFAGGGGDIDGNIYLYGWCPEMTVGGGPPD